MNTRLTLLLVDDDSEIREQMKWALASDYELLEASDRPSALGCSASDAANNSPRFGSASSTDGASEGLAVLRESLKSTRWSR